MKHATAVLLALLLPGIAAAQDAKMSFFITSVGSGKGGDLGGLAGADKHCQELAAAVGSKRTWRAYLSTSGAGAVNARDRIGKGPWFNAKGVQIAANLADLHGDKNAVTKETALTEKGEPVNGRGQRPNMHDMLTGSNLDGSAIADGDKTCHNWTSSGEGLVQTGHHDRVGDANLPHPNSWNSSHATEGCSVADLAKFGGAGLYYCFAAD